MGDQVEIRPLTADDDLDVQLDLSERAFGVKNADDRDTWRKLMGIVIAGGTSRAAFDGGRAAGASVYFDMRQWWLGRPVPMAGVSGVKVAPEDQGRGIGRRMMTWLLGDIAARGFPLAVLYPATMHIYRSLGWELAGGRYTVTVPGRSLRDLEPADIPARTPDAPAPGLRRAGVADAGTVIDVVGRALTAARASGPLTWDDAATRLPLEDAGWYSYLCDDGFLTYRWDGDSVTVNALHAASPGTLRTLWSLVASHATMAETVSVRTGPDDPLWWLTRERDAGIKRRGMWMLRVVDAPAAIAARGFPLPVSAEIPLVIEDRSLPANSGHWTLSVAGGSGSLVRSTVGTVGGAEPLTLGARGLAALYGGAPVASLRLAGLAAGGTPDADACLEAAFAATPYLLDAF